MEDGTRYRLLESDGADPFAKSNITNIHEQETQTSPI